MELNLKIQNSLSSVDHMGLTIFSLHLELHNKMEFCRKKEQNFRRHRRTMLISSGLPKNFWAKAINTACCLLNRCMIKPILKKTPYELLRGRKPNITNLRAFGCKYFMYNNGKEALGKFDDRSDEGIFLGYSPHSKAYKIFNKRTICVEENIDVIFDKSNNLAEKGLQDEDYDIGFTSDRDTKESDKDEYENHKEINSDHEEPEEDRATLTADHNNKATSIEPIPLGNSSGVQTRNKLDEQGNITGNKARLVVQAPRAWYERLSKFPLANNFIRGKVGNTLFLRSKGMNILIVQVYVDDIIFGSTNKAMCEEFAEMMGNEFEMSIMGELNFFLGL
uniref:Uncharacterized protein LOC104228028 n=1 Tax=Nicotiana sylvestris TaxID=4096 RepID=A0A1U7WWU2_NICSY|nr:PREDICTED: uncharacterized protein LOC104228028 [Nicotiana sylvestris]